MRRSLDPLVRSRAQGGRGLSVKAGDRSPADALPRGSKLAGQKGASPPPGPRCPSSNSTTKRTCKVQANFREASFCSGTNGTRRQGDLPP
ncbi:hypothetical protein H8959_021612 [Pygathrix nigripes]